MTSEESQSVLEYARFHGLTLDHTKFDPFGALEKSTDAYPDDNDLPQIKFSDLALKPERLAVSKDDLRFLSACLEKPTRPDFRDVLKTRWDHAQELRMELPMHRRDPKLEMTDYFSSLEQWKEEFCRPGSLPMPDEDSVNPTSPKLDAVAAEVHRSLTSEKLVLSKDDMLFLQKCLKAPSYRDVETCWNDLLEIDEGQVPSPMLSPIMPRSPGHNMPPLPDMPSFALLDQEIENHAEKSRRIEDELSKRDILLDTPTKESMDGIDAENDIGRVYSPRENMEKQKTIEVRNSADLRMDEPMTPPDTDRPQEKLALTVPGLLDEAGVKLPLPITPTENTSMDDLEEIMQETEPIVNKFKHAIENEKLDEPRIARKMELPTIKDEPLPNPPWRVDALAEPEKREQMRSSFLKKVQSDLMRHSDNHIEALESSLQWLKARDLEIKEDLTCDINLEHWIAVPQRMDPKAFVTPACDALDDDDSDLEEIERADLPGPADFSVLLQQRKRDMCEASFLTDFTNESRPNRHDSDTLPSKRQRRTLFSPMGAVDDFITARCGTNSSIKGREDAIRLVPTETDVDVEPERAQTNIHKPQKVSQEIDVPLPAIQASPPKAQCIISFALMNSRGLIKHIQRLYPSLELFERDFNGGFSASVQAQAGQLSSMGTVDSPSREADIILSPTTGIILTTVQKLQQRPLPGSKSPQALQARLVSVAPRYETLILVVSQNPTKDASPVALTPSDSAAVAEITSFGKSAYFKSLNTDVSVILCLGGERHVAHWVVALMVQHSRNISGVVLKQEEAPWEVWLRRLGMNAFAAQAILSSLNNSGSSNGPQDKSIGLPELVQMDASERTGRLSGALGPATLERLNKILDASWG